MNANELYPSKYLKASDVGDHKPVVTIESLKIEELGQGDKIDRRPILYFKDKEKGLVLNKTNNNTMIKLFGAETDAWIGKRIKLIVCEVQFKGEMVPALRISSLAVAQDAARKPVPEPVEEPDLDVSGEDVPF